LVNGADGATLSLKHISVTHDDMLFSKLLTTMQKYGMGGGKQYKPKQLAKKNWLGH
jgi:hypothetical protein